MGPVHGNVQIVAGQQLHQAAFGQLRADHQRRVHAPAHAQLAGPRIALVGRQKVARRAAPAFRAQALQPLVLQAVLAAVAHHGRACHGLGRDAVLEVAADEVGAGGRHVAHASQRPGVAARNGRGRGRDGGHHLALADALGRVVLVVDADVQQLVAVAREGGHGVHEPGGQRVGIDGQQRGQGRLALGHQFGVLAAQVVFQQGDLLHMQAQAAACLRA